MTIYGDLRTLGYTPDEIKAASEDHASSREFSLAYADTPDSTPIIGVQYGCDFRAEEERGVGELQAAFGLTRHKWQIQGKNDLRIGTFTGKNAPAASLVLSVTPMLAPENLTYGQDILPVHSSYPLERGSKSDPTNRAETYDQYLDAAQRYAQGFDMPNRWQSVARLQEIAKKRGVEKPYKTKAALLKQIEASQTPEHPNTWAGWFHYGDVLILTAERGIVADALRLLYAAGRRGTLAFGGGSQVFGSGMSLYDGRDVGPKLNRERWKAARWYDKQMSALKPIEKELKAKGHSWYFLGKPRNFKSMVNRGDVDPHETYYWLNGCGHGPGYTSQPYGWYTLQELRDEKFVKDASK